jgi:hypothetical protein
MSIPKQLASGLTFELFAKWTNKTILGPTTFYLCPCSKPGRGAVIYWGIEFASFYDFDFGFWNYSDNGIV